MTARLFLREVRNAVVQKICQRGGEWPIHTVDGPSVSKMRPPGGM